MIQDPFVRREAGGLAYYSCIALEKVAGLRHGFSTRHGGTSALPEDALNLSFVPHDLPGSVTENRRRFLEALNVEKNQLATVSQIHSDRLVLVEDAAMAGRGPEGDAIGTALAGVAVAVRVADCFPLLVADPRANAIAAIHAGWRGVLHRIFSKTAAGMKAAYGSDPRDWIVTVGPGIRSCCFEVGMEVSSAFAQEFPGAELIASASSRPGKVYLDLTRALRIQFTESGVDPANVFDLGACTCCHTDEFFSYRAEGPQSGRMMALICREC
jgi:polyphenol oxidase